MRDIAILGAGGHARDILWLLENINKSLAEKEQWRLLGFYDKNPTEHSMCDYPIYDEKELYNKKDIAIVCGLGTPSARKKIVENIKEKNPSLYFPSLISPESWISKRAKIGTGVQMFPGTMIMGGDVRIGDFTVIHIASTIGHDSHIGDYVQINPGCNISGGDKIDDGVFLGTGVKIAPQIHIAENAIIGIGSVVVSDIPPNCTAVGYPARAIKRNNSVKESK